MAKAEFRTGYDQREVVLDVIVGADMEVGDMVAYADDTNTISVADTLATADYIIAQSDMTMEYGHVPVEARDHRYNPKVAKSTTAKKVAVFFIKDESDIIVKG